MLSKSDRHIGCRLSKENIMLHDREIRIRLSNIQMAVSQAAQALSAERHLTGELRDAIQKLDRRSDEYYAERGRLHRASIERPLGEEGIGHA